MPAIKKHIGLSVCVLILGLGLYLMLQAQDGHPPPGECPQPRFTGKAPANVYRLKNPLPASKENIKAGQKLYRSESKPVACQECHGKKGDGKGSMAEMFDPPPRNFACKQTVNGIPDGQLFWIIQNGS